MSASEACGAHGAVAAGNGVDAPASTDAGHARISRHSLNSTHSWTASRARHANHAEEAPRASRSMNAPPSPFPVQRKTLAGPFRPAGYARHSQAANGSCRGGSLSLYLHREYLYVFRPGLPDPSDPPGGGFYRHMPIASCFFVCRECSRHTKSPGLQSRPGWISLPSRETSNSRIWQTENSEDPKPPTHGDTATTSNSTTGSRHASGSCSMRRDEHRTSRASSSSVCWVRSCGYIKATRRPHDTSRGSATCIGSSPVWATTTTRSCGR